LCLPFTSGGTTQPSTHSAKENCPPARKGIDCRSKWCGPPTWRVGSCGEPRRACDVNRESGTESANRLPAAS
jgi:hypothetical protein